MNETSEEVDREILFLLGMTEKEVKHRWPAAGMDAAQRASWSVKVSCCVRCRKESHGCGGLYDRHTMCRKCFPEAYGDVNDWPPMPPHVCGFIKTAG